MRFDTRKTDAPVKIETCLKSVSLEIAIMQTLLNPPKLKSARKGTKPRNKYTLPADEYLRLSKENEKTLSESIAAADRGELVEFDPTQR